MPVYRILGPGEPPEIVAADSIRLEGIHTVLAGTAVVINPRGMVLRTVPGTSSSDRPFRTCATDRRPGQSAELATRRHPGKQEPAASTQRLHGLPWPVRFEIAAFLRCRAERQAAGGGDSPAVVWRSSWTTRLCVGPGVRELRHDAWLSLVQAIV